jgi:hypothetical protein
LEILSYFFLLYTYHLESSYNLNIKIFKKSGDKIA